MFYQFTDYVCMFDEPMRMGKDMKGHMYGKPMAPQGKTSGGGKKKGK